MKLFVKLVLFFLTFITVTQANIPTLKSTYNLRSSEYGARYYEPSTIVKENISMY